MSRWQYAQLSNSQSGTDAVSFSHKQGPNLVQEFSAALGRGLKAEQSTAAFLHLNLNHTKPVVVAGQLGERGWELVAHATLTGGHEYWTFKKEL